MSGSVVSVTHLQLDFCMIHSLNPVATASVIHLDKKKKVLILQFHAGKQFINTWKGSEQLLSYTARNMKKMCVKLELDEVGVTLETYTEKMFRTTCTTGTFSRMHVGEVDPTLMCGDKTWFQLSGYDKYQSKRYAYCSPYHHI
jgi:hypothetical protein